MELDTLIGNKQIIFAVVANIVCSLLLSYDKLLSFIPNDIKYYISFFPWWGWCLLAIISFFAYIINKVIHEY